MVFFTGQLWESICLSSFFSWFCFVFFHLIYYKYLTFDIVKIYNTLNSPNEVSIILDYKHKKLFFGEAFLLLQRRNSFLSTQDIKLLLGRGEGDEI
jgi:hypothetical protein